MPSDDRKMPCCDDTLEVLSVEDEHQTNSFLKDFSPTLIALTPELVELEFDVLVGIADENLLSSIPEPPNIYREPLFKQHQSFTFYG